MSEKLAQDLWAMSPDEIAAWMLRHRIHHVEVGGIKIDMHPQAFNEAMARIVAGDAEKTPTVPPPEAEKHEEPIDGEQLAAESIMRARGGV